MTQLVDYLKDEDELIAQTAGLLLDAKESYEAGQLTYGEYHDIINDILDIRLLGDISDNVERKQRVQQIFQVLRELMGAVSLI